MSIAKGQECQRVWDNAFHLAARCACQFKLICSGRRAACTSPLRSRHSEGVREQAAASTGRLESHAGPLGFSLKRLYYVNPDNLYTGFACTLRSPETKHPPRVATAAASRVLKNPLT